MAEQTAGTDLRAYHPDKTPHAEYEYSKLEDQQQDVPGKLNNFFRQSLDTSVLLWYNLFKDTASGLSPRFGSRLA